MMPGARSCSVSPSRTCAESGLVLALDTDQNSATGDDGVEYALEWTASATPDHHGWYIEKWDGKAWVHPLISRCVAC